MSSALLEEEEETVSKLFGHDFTVPLNFSQTVPPHNPHMTHHSTSSGPTALENPQTADLCHRLGIDNPFKPGFGRRLDQRPTNQKDLDGGVEGPLPPREEWAPLPPREEWANPDEIALVEDDPVNTGDGEEDGVTVCSSDAIGVTVCSSDAAQQCTNPDEIHIDSDLDGEEGVGVHRRLSPTILNQKPVHGLAQEFDQTLAQKVLTQELDQALTQELDQALTQELDQALTQELDQGLTQELDQVVIQELDQALTQELDQALTQELDQALTQELDQGLTQELDQELDQSRREYVVVSVLMMW
ncbi:hypothetical protein EMCRGX_G029859 [Ephydatia muelleri]